MKGKTLRKQSIHGEIAASALLNLIISGNERCHSTDVYIKCAVHVLHKSRSNVQYTTNGDSFNILFH